jgi:ATP-dependent Clp protease ATP-binding subunit ClpB
MNSMPEELDKLERQIRQLEIEREAIKRENDEDKLKELNTRHCQPERRARYLKAKWKAEKEMVDKVQNAKAAIEQFKAGS